MGEPEVFQAIARRIPILGDGRCWCIGVDGPDGAGKSRFADDLAQFLHVDRSHPVVSVSIDDFHHPTSVRHRQGRHSPEGFWADSYDYERFRADVLEPFAPIGSRRYRTKSYDHATDTIVDPPYQLAPPSTVLIVEGIFLHRDELVDAWDLTVFLDVAFTETARRMALRDGTPADPDHPDMRRYVHAQRRYFDQCQPQQRATILIDNNELGHPRLIRG
ncbi:uridine kinase [Mycolicibacterium sp. YH-1]|uniref:uridine kinase n=1 Tax=Mycolicibacterium sp. YH-1 TaxID=2908837 RepID=UPI001F4BEBC0|nr:uridine kinase [Mycolicibacterium sp. YH-1]UNB52893.1 uridine kinase [Mycolicibacterium sp. YH-1]